MLDKQVYNAAPNHNHAPIAGSVSAFAVAAVGGNSDEYLMGSSIYSGGGGLVP